MAQDGVMRHGTARCGIVRHGVALHGLVRHGMMRHVWRGMRRGAAWCGTAWRGVAPVVVADLRGPPPKMPARPAGFFIVEYAEWLPSVEMSSAYAAQDSGPNRHGRMDRSTEMHIDTCIEDGCGCLNSQAADVTRGPVMCVGRTLV